MDALEKRRRTHALGERAIQYYVDTGLCVFCEADDCEGIPHSIDCDVGEASAIRVTAKRRAEKAMQRAAVDAYIMNITGDESR